MNLDELRSVQNRERATDSLQELRDTFYADVAAYVEGLRDERDRRADAADDPFADPEVSRLTDEIEMAEGVAEAIYERRVGKIVKQASLAAAGMGADQDGLTDEEQALYADLVERIQENKRHVLDVLAGDAEPVSFGDESAEPTAEPAGDPAGEPGAASRASGAESRSDASPAPNGEESVAASAAMGGDAGGQSADGDPADRAVAEAAAVASERAAGEQAGGDGEQAGGESDAGGDAPDVDRETVRITRDVGEIFGVDERTYTLETDDVVQLPAENAAPLVEREAAERLE